MSRLNRRGVKVARQSRGHGSGNVIPGPLFFIHEKRPHIIYTCSMMCGLTPQLQSFVWRWQEDERKTFR